MDLCLSANALVSHKSGRDEMDRGEIEFRFPTVLLLVFLVQYGSFGVGIAKMLILHFST
jgi:hypothetical protein